MSDLKCKDCKYWEAEDIEPVFDEFCVGMCHRFPPPKAQAMDSGYHAYVDWDNWCGEWTVKKAQSNIVDVIADMQHVLNNSHGFNEDALLSHIKRWREKLST
jgi:hypothetical protein